VFDETSGITLIDAVTASGALVYREPLMKAKRPVLSSTQG
jgi:hypothetical protein